jgi:hypothetical protein
MIKVEFAEPLEEFNRRQPHIEDEINNHKRKRLAEQPKDNQNAENSILKMQAKMRLIENENSALKAKNAKLQTENEKLRAEQPKTVDFLELQTTNEAGLFYLKKRIVNPLEHKLILVCLKRIGK